jgi:hypothetical protein
MVIDDIIGWVKGWRLDKFMTKLFKNSQDLWTKINPVVQEVIKEASMALEVVMKMQGQTPQFILDKIKDLVPSFNNEKLHEVLSKTVVALNIAGELNNPDLLTSIALIDKHIQSVNPEAKEGVAHTIATFIAQFATPPDTTFGVITSVMKFVFENFVKGKIKPMG